MAHRILALLALAVTLCLQSASAAEPRPRGRAIGGMFGAPDRNRDGCLSQDEAPRRPPRST